jgi:hypothetical protein
MGANEPPNSYDRMMRKRSPIPRDDIEVIAAITRVVKNVALLWLVHAHLFALSHAFRADGLPRPF